MSTLSKAIKNIRDELILMNYKVTIDFLDLLEAPTIVPAVVIEPFLENLNQRYINDTMPTSDTCNFKVYYLDVKIYDGSTKTEGDELLSFLDNVGVLIKDVIEKSQNNGIIDYYEDISIKYLGMITDIAIQQDYRIAEISLTAKLSQ